MFDQLFAFTKIMSLVQFLILAKPHFGNFEAMAPEMLHISGNSEPNALILDFPLLFVHKYTDGAPKKFYLPKTRFLRISRHSIPFLKFRYFVPKLIPLHHTENAGKSNEWTFCYGQFCGKWHNDSSTNAVYKIPFAFKMAKKITNLYTHFVAFPWLISFAYVRSS